MRILLPLFLFNHVFSSVIRLSLHDHSFPLPQLLIFLNLLLILQLHRFVLLFYLSLSLRPLARAPTIPTDVPPPSPSPLFCLPLFLLLLQTPLLPFLRLPLFLLLQTPLLPSPRPLLFLLLLQTPLLPFRPFSSPPSLPSPPIDAPPPFPPPLLCLPLFLLLLQTSPPFLRFLLLLLLDLVTPRNTRGSTRRLGYALCPHYSSFLLRLSKCGSSFMLGEF